MTDHLDVEGLVRNAITEVAPELAPELNDLDPDVDLWRELELDSMDRLTVMTRLSEATGRDIPERDYPSLVTMRSIRDYLA
ncbi:MAG TPA: acyl carrier protein [Ilumatobacteraceae bacterium]|jgi:acyl carrier protein|nr:acyl carrier protein [Ilumatobacteraceae bacterium]